MVRKVSVRVLGQKHLKSAVCGGFEQIHAKVCENQRSHLSHLGPCKSVRKFIFAHFRASDAQKHGVEASLVCMHSLRAIVCHRVEARSLHRGCEGRFGSSLEGIGRPDGPKNIPMIPIQTLENISINCKRSMHTFFSISTQVPGGLWIPSDETLRRP